MRAVSVRGRHFNSRQPSGLDKLIDCGMSLLLAVGAYVRDKNTSAKLCAKSAGGLMREGGGGVFTGHYSYTVRKISQIS